MIGNDGLRAALTAAHTKYDQALDVVLNDLHCKCCFDRVDLEKVIRWKLNSNQRDLATAVRNLAKNSDFDIEDLSSRAFRCSDDLGALLLVMQLQGVGKPIASAVLTAYDPCRFTVIDVRAYRALLGFGYLAHVPTDKQGLPPWLPYLGAAREVAFRLGWSLRRTDQALWAHG